jgi:hypothetical protein
MFNPPVYRTSERGQAALFMTMTLTVSMGLIGLVVDEGWGYWRQEACLTAAQSAVSAGIMYAMKNNATWPPSTCTAASTIVCQSTPTACPTNVTLPATPTTDVQAACYYAQQNGFTASGKQNMTIAANTGNPPTVSGVATTYYITARAVEKIPLTFLSAIAGRTSNLVSARATAAIVSTTGGSCVYVLDRTGSLALNASNGITVQSQCGFWINSSSATALSVVGGSQLQALDSTAIDLVGGYTNANGGSISPTPTHSSAATDPFLSKNVPLQRSVTGAHTYSCSYGSSGGCAHTGTATYACDYTNFSQTSWVSMVTMSPGVYCGGINIGNVNAVTFNPGVYILDGGGMNLGGSGGISGGVTGSGVSFFNTGTASTYKYINIANGVNPTLSAPTTGSMQGMLFYQDPSLSLAVNGTTTSTFAGGSSLNLSGSLYFPTTAINWSNGTNTTTGSVGMVVYDVTFTGGAYFKQDTTGITTLGSTVSSAIVE